MQHVLKNEPKGEMDPQDDGMIQEVELEKKESTNHDDEIIALRTQQLQEREALRQLLLSIEELNKDMEEAR